MQENLLGTLTRIIVTALDQEKLVHAAVQISSSAVYGIDSVGTRQSDYSVPISLAASILSPVSAFRLSLQNLSAVCVLS